MRLIATNVTALRELIERHLPAFKHLLCVIRPRLFVLILSGGQGDGRAVIGLIRQNHSYERSPDLRRLKARRGGGIRLVSSR
jgi:hypothetical protein